MQVRFLLGVPESSIGILAYAVFCSSRNRNVVPNFACRPAAGGNLGETSGGGFDHKWRFLLGVPKKDGAEYLHRLIFYDIFI